MTYRKVLQRQIARAFAWRRSVLVTPARWSDDKLILIVDNITVRIPNNTSVHAAVLLALSFKFRDRDLKVGSNVGQPARVGQAIMG